MNGLKAVGKTQVWILKNIAAGIRREPRLKVVFITVAVAFFWFGTFALLYERLSFFGAFPMIGPALQDEAIYLFFAALFIMLTLSSTVICYITYYSSTEMNFLFTKPISDSVIFFYRFFQSVIFSSWAFLFLGVPFIIAYALLKHVALWFYLLIPLYFIPFIILPTGIASVIVLMFVTITSYRRAKYILAILIGSLSLAAVSYYTGSIRPILFVRSDIDYFIDNLLRHVSIFKHPLFPGYWTAKSVVLSAMNDYRKGLFYLTAFVLTTLVFLQLNWIISEKIFFSGWASSQGESAKKYVTYGNDIIDYISFLFSFLPRFTTAMIIKDAKEFMRNPQQWFQFLIYFGILGIYIVNLRNLPLSIDNSYWKIIIIFLNLAATALVLAGLTVRFFYPLMSLEGNKFWILGLAPITFRNLLFQKFIVGFLGVLCVSELLIITTNVMLDTTVHLMVVSTGIVAMASLALVGLSIGLGSIYPSFKEDNSAKIVSGFGGTLNFIVALTYVIFVIVSFAIPFFAYDVYHTISKNVFSCAMATSWLVNGVLTIFVGIIPMILGYRQLENMEF